MYSLSHRHICVFYKGESGKSAPEINNNSQNNEKLQREAKKWGQEMVSTIFQNSYTQKDSAEALKKEISKLKEKGIDASKDPYSTIIRELELFSKDIFGKDGKYRSPEEVKKRIENLRKAVGMEGYNSPREVEKSSREVKEFLDKYPIQKFRDTVFGYAIEHPIRSSTWIFFNDYRDLKKQVQNLGSNIGPEYGAIISTVENIMQSKEFSDNTGNVEVAIRKKFGQGKTVEEFQKNMKAFLDISIKQKRGLTMAEFDKYFGEERELNDAEKAVTNNFIQTLKLELSKGDKSKEEKLRITQAYRGELLKRNDIRKKQLDDLIKLLLAEELIIKGSANNDIQGETGKALRNLTSTHTYEDMLKVANELTLKNRTPYIVDYDKKKGEYVIVTMNDIANSILDKDLGDLDQGVFKNILQVVGGRDYLEKIIGVEGMAAIGRYISKRPNTALFTGIEGQKSYFINIYHQYLEKQRNVYTSIKLELIQGDISILYKNISEKLPQLKENDTLQKYLKNGEFDKFYDELAKTGITTRKMKELMHAVDKDSEILLEKSRNTAIEKSQNFKGKQVKDLTQFLLIQSEEDKAFIQSIGSRYIASSNTLDSQEKIKLRQMISDKNSELYKYIDSLITHSVAAQGNGQSKQMLTILDRNKDGDTKVAPLSINDRKTTLGRGVVSATIEGGKLNDLLSINANPRNAEEVRQVNAAKIKSQKEIANVVNNFSKLDGVTKEDLRSIYKTSIKTGGTNKEADSWIKTQKFLSKYIDVDSKFVNEVERRAAIINTGEYKSIGELYGQKADISSMSYGENLSIGSTTLSRDSGLSGIQELMDCKISMCEGSVFQRNILAPDGTVLVKNIPIDTIEPAIENLGRYFLLGLGKLAPYIGRITQSMSKARPDSVSGLNGDYTHSEDIKFLKIMTTLIYGAEQIPQDNNTNSFIRLFHSSDVDNNPIRRLKKLGYLSDNDTVNITRLQTGIREASNTVA